MVACADRPTHLALEIVEALEADPLVISAMRIFWPSRETLMLAARSVQLGKSYSTSRTMVMIPLIAVARVFGMHEPLAAQPFNQIDSPIRHLLTCKAP
ncbi:MAG: hypothetical protein BGP05_17595 [Rhizobiales bacterium 62-47]|nr:MAG: hypothetical protein BGP05_17595 [Rhizobiales bacterium 62-47]